MVRAFLLITYYLGFILLGLGVSSVITRVFYFFEAKILFIEWEIYEFNGVRIIGTALFD